MLGAMYLERVRFQLELDERWPDGGWLEVMDHRPDWTPSVVSSGIMGAVGRVLCMEAVLSEDPDAPAHWRLMFDFRNQPLEVWDEHRPWTCWTDGQFTRVPNRPDVWRWWVVDPTDGERLGMVCYLNTAPPQDEPEMAVTDGHRRMCDERAAELFPEGLDLGELEGREVSSHA